MNLKKNFKKKKNESKNYNKKNFIISLNKKLKLFIMKKKKY